MDRILRFLRPLITLCYKYPYWVIGFAIISGIAGGYFATQLKLNTDLAHLLPQDNPHVEALQELQQTVGGGTSMAVTIKSPSFEDNLRFAKDFIHQSLQLRDSKRNAPFFSRGSYKHDVKVLKNNALYFATPKELNEIISYLQGQIEEANRKANPFLINIGTPEQPDTSNEKLEDFKQAYNQLIPTKYTISPDSTIMVVRLEPASKTNIAYINRLFSSLDSLITAMNPASYNKEMKVYTANRLWTHLHLIKSIQKDVFSSFGTGLASIILLVMIYFFIRRYLSYRKRSGEERSHRLFAHILRIPVAALVIGLPLLLGLTWTFGITYGVLGSLNTMTAVLFVILFGFAIDYGLHFYARYLEFRSAGHNVGQAIYKTYDNAGSAIAASGLTTSFSLYILLFANIKGFSDFGFVAGTGVLLSLFCMLFVLPALLVIFERWNWILISPGSQKQPVTASGSSSRYPFSRTIVIIGTVIALVVIANYNHLNFQYNFGKLQPTFEKARVFDHFVSKAIRGKKRHKRRNPAYLLADNRQQVKEVAQILRHRMRTDTISPTIYVVEAITERFPATPQQVQTKLQKIAKIRKLLNKPVFENRESDQLEKLRKAAQTVEPLSLSEIPDYFASKFTTKSGEIGNFVIVYPSVTLADSRNSIAFMRDVGKVTLSNGETVYAASTSIIGAQIILLLQRESPWLIGGTLAMFFLLSFYSFRSIKWALIAMAPLIIGLLFMFGIMMLTGALLNLYNLIILPAILGVGGDNGIHTVSRYLEEGPGSAWTVIKSTGEHSAICSFANMLGFSGLFFSSHPGLKSMGFVAVTGIGMTLVTAFIFLPALIQWLEDKNWISYQN